VGAGGSDVGDQEVQEDAWLVTRRDGALLCAVCDGMGGMAPGRAASDLAIAMLRAPFEQAAPIDTVLSGLMAANAEILARSTAAPRGIGDGAHWWHGSGTTAEVALFVQGRAHLAHVGDGRIARLRRGTLEALTTEHTLVNEHRRLRSDLTEAQLASLPRNVVVRALGMKPDLEVDRSEVDTVPGDVFLLCSDGLTACLDDGAIQAILASSPSAEAMVARLLAAAKASPDGPRAFRDNVTAVVHVVGAGGNV
jgi:PPM family protein phosphatase